MKKLDFKKLMSLALAMIMLVSLSPVSFADAGVEEAEGTEVSATVETEDTAENAEEPSEPENEATEPPDDEDVFAFPWEGLCDEDFAAWVTCGDNDAYIVAQLASEGEEAAAFAARIDAIADASLLDSVKAYIDALPAFEAEDEAEEGEEEEADESSLLPCGFAGMGEGFELSTEQLKAKQTVSEKVGEEALAAMVPGVDYAEGRLILLADSAEYAQQVADAYCADLISYSYGLAVISPREATVAEAFACAMDPEIPLPLVEPDYIGRFCAYEGSPAAGEVSAMSGDSVPVKQTWETVIEGMSSPDPLLQDPMAADYQWQHDAVGSYYAWGVTTGSSNVRVALLGNGVSTGYELAPFATTFADASGMISDPVDYLGSGNALATIIAGLADDGISGAGIAPDVSIASIKVVDGITAYLSDVIQGLEIAQSYSSHIIAMTCSFYEYSADLDKAVQDAITSGATVIAPAGNDGTNNMVYPAALSYNGLIGVYASDKAGQRWFASNYGSVYDIAAPGVGIYGTGLSNADYAVDGTAASVAVTAGVCALYMSVYSNPGPVAVEKIIKNAAVGGIVNTSKLFKSVTGTVKLDVLDDMYNECTSLYPSGSTIPYGYVLDFSVETPYNDDPSDPDCLADAFEGKIVYTTNGKNPSILNGVTVNGNADYPGFQLITSNLGDVGDIITVKAACVSGIGVMGKIKTFKFIIGKPMPTSVDVVTIPDYIISGTSVTLTSSLTPSGCQGGVEWMCEIPAGQVGKVSSASISSTGVLTSTLFALDSNGNHVSSGYVKVWCVSSVDNSIESPQYIVYVKAKPQYPVKTMDPLNAGGVKVLYVGEGSITIPDPDCYDKYADPVTPGFKWTSSNTKVATVDVNGVVTPVGNGSVTITCMALDGSKVKRTISFTVKTHVSSFTLSGPDEIAKGKTGTFKVTDLLPAKASNKNILWSVSDSTQAKISTSGVVTIKSGATVGATFTVTATAKDGSGISDSITVTVTAPVTSIKIDNPAGGRIYTVDLPSTSSTDNEYQLTATILGNSGVGVQWTSSNTKVATVDSTGLVTGVGSGTATIKIKALDGTGKTASYTIKVVVPASYLEIIPGSTAINGEHYIAAGMTVKNKLAFGNAFGAVSSKTATWSYDVQHYVDGVLDTTDITTYYCQQKKLVTVNNGQLWVSASLAKYAGYNAKTGEDHTLTVRVTAVAKDGTACSDYVIYTVTKVTTSVAVYRDDPDVAAYTAETKYALKTKTLKVYNEDSPVSLFIRFSDDYLGNDSKTYVSAYPGMFTVKSSNPAVLGVQTDGTNWITLIPGRNTGTATITVTAANGTARAFSVTVTVIAGHKP